LFGGLLKNVAKAAKHNSCHPERIPLAAAGGMKRRICCFFEENRSRFFAPPKNSGAQNDIVYLLSATS